MGEKLTTYRFDNWEVEPHTNRIRRDGADKQLEPLSMNVLTHLLECAGEVVTSDSLLDLYWRDRNAEPSMVARCISQIRNALVDDARNPVYIETIRKRGYRAIAPVSILNEPQKTSQNSRSGPDPIVVAVLPFSDQSLESNQRHLCEGLAEDLMDALFGIERLSVLSAIDGLRPASEWAAEDQRVASGACAVLNGSVRTAGDRLEIRARLVRTDTSLTIWSKRFSCETNDAFRIQSQIARGVLEALQSVYGLRETHTQLPEGHHRDPIALDLLDRASRETPQMAALLLECAIAQDPGCNQAYVELIKQYTQVGPFYLTGEQRQKKLQSILHQLKSNDPKGAAVFDALASMSENMTDLARLCADAIKSGERVHAYPHPARRDDVRTHYASALCFSGLPLEALEYFRFVDRKGEPNRGLIWGRQAGCYQMRGEFEEAIDRYGALKRKVPGFPFSGYESICHLSLGNLEAAEALGDQEGYVYRFFVEPTIRWMKDGSTESPSPRNPAEQEWHGYHRLAIGDVEGGFDAIESCVGSIVRPSMAWRILLSRHLFHKYSLESPRFRLLLNNVGLDAKTREGVQAGVNSLRNITGVRAQPLMPI